MRVILLGSGRGSNAEAILEAQHAGRLGRACVVQIFSDRADAGILALGPQFGVAADYLDPAPFKTKLEGEGEARYIATINACRADLVVLAGFMRVLKPGFLAAFAGRIVNLHPSLLPSFPGLDGIGQAWRRGVKVTGCTVHFVTAEVDGGPIIDQAAVRIEPGDTLETLTNKVHAAEHDLLPAVIARLSEGQGSGMSLFEIKVEVSPESADAANEVLLDLGNEAWSVLENVIAKQAWIVGIFASAEEAAADWAGLKPLLPAAKLGDVTSRELGDADWRDSYKAHFRAWKFGRLHWVPVWERETFRLPAGEAVLWLDPGMAFGTGNHETTRLCVERLIELAERTGPSGRVIDAGCGSGILALSAAKLGYVDVAGFDNDPEAVRVSRENAALNGLEHAVEFFVDDLRGGLAGVQADVLLANILANLLIEFAHELTTAVAPGGTLVLSGILAEECDNVRASFGAMVPDWPQESRTMGEWSDVVLRRPTD